MSAARRARRRSDRLKLLLDINIILDVILEREGLFEESALILSAIETGRASGFVASHTIPTTFYLIEKARDRETASIAVSGLLAIVEVVPLEGTDFQQAYLFPVNDFEDAVQVAAALKIGADYLVTRNLRDYKRIADETLRVRSPAEILPLLDAEVTP